LTADGGITLVQPGSRVTGARLRANLPSKKADVRGDVTFVRSAGQPSGAQSGPVPGQAPNRPSPAAAPGASPSPSERVAGALAKEETIITAGRIVFRWDVNEAEAEDSVVARQRDKTAWADRMVYSESLNRLLMTGNVILEQTSGDWLVREGVAPSPREPAERQALASMTRVTCTRLTMTLRERDIVAEGPLTVTQKNRSASGDRGAYTEATRLLVVTGNVKMQDADGQRLRADRVVISLVEETFDAEGNVQTEFVIRSSPTAGAGPSDRPSPTPRP
jgi:lipopolysaccharide export system protein LptA